MMTARVVVGTLLLLSPTCWAQRQKSAPVPKLHVTCNIINYPTDVVDAKTGTSYEEDNWVVEGCSITRGDKILLENYKPTAQPYPQSMHEAMDVYDNFRRHAEQIAKDKETRHGTPPSNQVPQPQGGVSKP